MSMGFGRCSIGDPGGSCSDTPKTVISPVKAKHVEKCGLYKGLSTKPTIGVECR